MSKYSNKSGGKVVGIVLSTILVIAVIAVISLIFYPEIKEAFTVTIPENMEQIRNDVNANEKEDKETSGSGQISGENETVGEKPTTDVPSNNIDEIIEEAVNEASQIIE